MTTRILDVRRPEVFENGHVVGAVNIALEELSERIHELPPSGSTLAIHDNDPARVQAAIDLLTRSRRWLLRPATPDDLHAAGPMTTGPSRARLWKPHAWLESALSLIRDGWGDLAGRSACDLACGTGRDAVYLATAGLQVVAVDLLPDALQRAARLAERCGVRLTTIQCDLESGNWRALGRFDIVCVFRFLHRPLLADLRALVRPGGFAVVETFLVGQRAAYGKPARDAHLLAPGELAGAFADWSVVRYHEGAAAPRSITAAIVAQRPELV